MLIAIVYIVPLLLAIILAAPKVISLIKSTGRAGKESEITEEHSKRFESISKHDIHLSELKKIRPLLIYQMWILIKAIAFVYMFPIAMLRMTLFLRWGSKISWLLPVSFYEVWQLIFLTLSFYYSYKNFPLTGAVLAIIVGINVIFLLLSDFEEKKGTLRILRYPTHKLNLRNIIENGIMLVLTFGAIYYALNVLNPNTFSSKLSILDAVYFSLITIATVGYGDINPLTKGAKILVIMEVFLGLLYMLFVVSVFVSVFLKRHIDKTKNGQENEKRDTSE